MSRMIYKYPKTPHWPTSLSVHRDDHYHLDPNFFVNKKVMITEKLDGGNTKIQDGKVYARSVSGIAHQPWFDYVKTNTVPKLYQVDPNICVLGEDLYAIHSIEYDVLPDSFFLFNILDTHTNTFWSAAEVQEFSIVYDLHHVPILYEGTFSHIDNITDWFMDNLTKPSTFGTQCEGFVLRIADSFDYDDFGQNVVKFVRKNHIQTDERWEKNWKSANIIIDK